MDPDVIFASEEYVLVNKRANDHIDGDYPHTVSKFVKERYGSALPPGKAWPWLCHQLDMPTSGCMLLALSKAAASRAGREFNQRRVGKAYLAVCEGVLGAPGESFAWSWPIGDDLSDPLQFRMCVPPGDGGDGGSGPGTGERESPLAVGSVGGTEGGESGEACATSGGPSGSGGAVAATRAAAHVAARKAGSPELASGEKREDGRQAEFRPASTKATVISLGSYADPGSPGVSGVSRPVTLVALRPYTGRRHQLRVHLARAGHPIVNDVIYNPRYSEGRGRLPSLNLEGREEVAPAESGSALPQPAPPLPRLYLHAWLLSLPRLFADRRVSSLVYSADTAQFLQGVKLELEPEKLEAALRGFRLAFTGETQEGMR